MLVVTRFPRVGLDTTIAVGWVAYDVSLSPQAFFGYLLGVEMLIALQTLAPAARLADSVGLKPIVAAGFAVYAVFPVIRINMPASAAH